MGSWRKKIVMSDPYQIKSSHRRTIKGKIYEQWIKVGNTVDKSTIDDLIEKDKSRGMSVVKVKPTNDETKWGRIKFILKGTST